jgi:hypothetical protein
MATEKLSKMSENLEDAVDEAVEDK